MKEWENHMQAGWQKLPPHADRNYSEKISLNGLWQFGSFYSIDALEYFYDLSLPNQLEVPSHPELSGYDIPIYTNIQYPFPVDPPHVPHENNPCSVYRREFELPRDWQGQKVIISFQGADSFLKVAVNGQFAGWSKGSRNPAEFDITEFLKPGTNRIDAATLRWSDATYIEDQDMWWMSGIFREVFLYTESPCFIRDFEVKTTLDEFRLKVKTAKPCTVSVNLEGIFEGEINSEEELVKKVQVKPWSAEAPNLYKLILKTPDDTLETNVGFRTVEIRDGELFVNGSSVKLLGVNHHEFNCRRGRAVTEEDMLWDVKTLKAHNFNAVRNSHYPHQSRWYELCDQYGLYVIDEADMEAHGMSGALSKDPSWLNAYLDRQQRMLERNKNHPSIIIWSMGNESGYGENIDACSEYLHKRDASRPVNYFHAHSNFCVDIVGMHYPSLDEIRKLLETETSNRPILLEEFAHSMGNGTGNMDEYIKLWESEKRLIGGFIWDWIDQGLVKIGPDGKEFFAYGGDFGDKPNDYQFCHNGIVAPDRKAKAAMSELKHLFRPFVFSVQNGELHVKNRYNFLNLSDFEVIVNGQILAAECPPETEKILLTKVPDYLEISVSDKHGNLIEEEQFGLPEMPSYPSGNDTVPSVLEFDKAGNLVRWNDLELESFKLELWRAPTNNDRPFLEMWRNSRIDEDWSVLMEEPIFKDNTVTVRRKSPFYQLEYIYKYNENGFDLTVDFTPTDSLPAFLPKLGLTLKLPDSMDKLYWFGRGPEECYRDRCSGIKIGKYSASADELWNTYLMPQENGNHCDVYFAGVCNKDGIGIGCRSEIPFETALHRWDAKTLDMAKHEYELPSSNNVFWQLDWQNAGIGNGSHGPGTLEKYCVKVKKTTWKWSFFGFDKKFLQQFGNKTRKQL